jgi:predicted transcriptional regulator
VNYLREWECTKCGKSYQVIEPPEVCPNCKRSGQVWIDSWKDIQSQLDFPVRNFVNKKLITIDEDATVLEASRLLKAKEVRSIIVTRAGEPIGIVTERDIVYRGSELNLLPSDSKLTKIMASPIINIDSSEPISSALQLMKKNNLRRLLVKEGNQPIGMVTQAAIIGDSINDDHPQDKLKTPR